MKKLLFESDNERFLIKFDNFELSFYFEDGKIVKDRAEKIMYTIQDFIDNLKIPLKDNQYWCQYTGMYKSEMNLCLQTGKTPSERYYGFQLSYSSIDYFDEITIHELANIKGYLELFIIKLIDKKRNKK